MIEQLRAILLKTLHLKMLHFCEAPRFMLSNYFGKKQELGVTFWAIWPIKNQRYPQTSFESKYGAFYLKDKVSAHGLVLLFQLS